MNDKALGLPANIEQRVEGRKITRLMYLIWEHQPDLRRAFDLGSESGQQAYLEWFAAHGETGEIHQQISAFRAWLKDLESQLMIWAKKLPSGPKFFLKTLWVSLRSQRLRWARKKTVTKNEIASPKPTSSLERGVTLIGYAKGELGMGEHVRMSAAAFSLQEIPFAIYDSGWRLGSRQKANLLDVRKVDKPLFTVNLFHLNAHEMPAFFRQVGRGFFEGHYNILYPFWELPKWPESWIAVLDMIDEVWAPTRFIEKALLEVSPVPVRYMPVGLNPELPLGLNRSNFCLPEDDFLFFFSFDFFSFIQRKNPIAVVKAFLVAFADLKEKVGLVIKVMNVDAHHPEWKDLMALVSLDRRVHFIYRTLDRRALMDLYKLTDAYVSLHRSEGLGLGPMEAMYYGKPVIVTNFSGCTDFANEANALLVDYELIPVGKSDYFEPEGQYWAEPNIETAATQMRRLFDNRSLAGELGSRAALFIREGFSSEVSARCYNERLTKLRLGR